MCEPRMSEEGQHGEQFSRAPLQTYFSVETQALALRKFFSTALTFSASAIAMAPSGPMLLAKRLSSVETAVTFSASAIA